jgi:hypothetical protein
MISSQASSIKSVYHGRGSIYYPNYHRRSTVSSINKIRGSSVPSNQDSISVGEDGNKIIQNYKYSISSLGFNQINQINDKNLKNAQKSSFKLNFARRLFNAVRSMSTDSEG